MVLRVNTIRCYRYDSLENEHGQHRKMYYLLAHKTVIILYE